MTFRIRYEDSTANRYLQAGKRNDFNFWNLNAVCCRALLHCRLPGPWQPAIGEMKQRVLAEQDGKYAHSGEAIPERSAIKNPSSYHPASWTTSGRSQWGGARGPGKISRVSAGGATGSRPPAIWAISHAGKNSMAGAWLSMRTPGRSCPWTEIPRALMRITGKKRLPWCWYPGRHLESAGLPRSQ